MIDYELFPVKISEKFRKLLIQMMIDLDTGNGYDFAQGIKAIRELHEECEMWNNYYNDDY